jgi:hypothetical protein
MLRFIVRQEVVQGAHPTFVLGVAMQRLVYPAAEVGSASRGDSRVGGLDDRLVHRRRESLLDAHTFNIPSSHDLGRGGSSLVFFATPRAAITPF